MSRHVDADYTEHRPRRKATMDAPPIAPPNDAKLREIAADLIALDARANNLTQALVQAGMTQQTTALVPTQQGMMTTNASVWRPELLKINDERPPLGTMLGVPGIPIYNGIINDPAEYNKDFYWRDGIAIYDEMYRSDAQSHQVVQVMARPIRRAHWDVQPVSDAPIDTEIASFVKSALFDDMITQTQDGEEIIQTWDDILKHALLMMPYGFSCMEYVWRRDKEGWTKWGCWAPILPRTVWRWWTGGSGELLGIQQYAYKDGTFQLIEIPAKKLIRFTFDQHGNNYDGVSALRAAYPHWYYKTQYYAIEALGHERTSVPMPVIHLPAGASTDDYAKAQIIGANLRANEKMNVVLPEGWQIDYLQGHADSEKIHTSIDHHDRMIARSVGAMFLNLGGERGAFNLDKSQTATFQQAIQAEADYVAERITASAIRKIVRANYDGVKVYPRLVCNKISTQDLEGLSKLIQNLAGFVNPDPTLEDWLREEAGLPAAAPVSDPYEINSDNPSGGDAGGSGDEADQSGGDSGGASDGDQNQTKAAESDTAAAASENSDHLSWLMDETHDAIEAAIIHFTDDSDSDTVELAFGGGRAGGRPHGGLGGIGGEHLEIRSANGEFAGRRAGGHAHHEAVTEEGGGHQGHQESAAGRRQREYRERNAERLTAQKRVQRAANSEARRIEIEHAAREEAIHGPNGGRVHPPRAALLHRIAEVSPVADSRSLSDITWRGADGEVLHTAGAGMRTQRNGVIGEGMRAAAAGVERQMRASPTARIVGVSQTGTLHELGAHPTDLRTLDPHTLALLHGGVIIVNHPLGGAPKLSEMGAAARVGAIQLRVVTPFYRHAISSANARQALNAEAVRHLGGVFRTARDTIVEQVKEAIAAKEVSPWHAMRQIGHVAWQRVATPARLHYVRAAWDETSALMREESDDESIQLAFGGARFGARPTGGIGGEHLEIRSANGEFAGRRAGNHQYDHESQRGVHEHLAAHRSEEGALGGAGRSSKATRAKSPNEGAAKRTTRTAKAEGATKAGESVKALRARGEQARASREGEAIFGPGVTGNKSALMRKWNTLHERYDHARGQSTHEGILNDDAMHLELLVRRGWGPGSAPYDRAEAHFNETKKAMQAEQRAAAKPAKTTQAKAPAAKKTAAAKAPKQTAAERNAAEITALHTASAKWQAAHPSALKEAQPGVKAPRPFHGPDLEHASPYATLNPAQLAHDFGEHQLGAVLVRATPKMLREGAAAVGVRPGGTKAALVSRITAAATNGHYSANFAKAPAKALAPGEQAPRISVRSHVHQGKDGFLIHGTDRQGRRISIFSQSKPEAEHIRNQVKNGEEVTFFSPTNLAESSNGDAIALAFGIGGLVRGAFGGKGAKGAGHGGHYADGRAVKRQSSGRFNGSEKGQEKEKAGKGRGKGLAAEHEKTGKQTRLGVKKPPTAGQKKAAESPNAGAKRRVTTTKAGVPKARPKAVRATKAAQATAASRQELNKFYAPHNKTIEQRKADAEARVSNATKRVTETQKAVKASQKALDEAGKRAETMRETNKTEISRLHDERASAENRLWHNRDVVKEQIITQRAHERGKAGAAPAQYQRMLEAEPQMAAARAKHAELERTSQVSDARYKALQAQYEPHYNIFGNHAMGMNHIEYNRMFKEHPDLKAAQKQYFKDSGLAEKAKYAMWRYEGKYTGAATIVAGFGGVKGRKALDTAVEAHPSIAKETATRDLAMKRIVELSGEGQHREAFNAHQKAESELNSARQEQSDAQMALGHPEWNYKFHSEPLHAALYTNVGDWSHEQLAAAKLADKGAGSSTNVHKGDQSLAEIQRIQGFDHKPDLISEGEMNAHIKMGEQEIWRGDTKARHAENLLQGEYHPGLGVFGNGTYAQSAEQAGREIASSYANKHGFDKGALQGRIMRMTIKQGARVIDYGHLKSEAQHAASRASEGMKAATKNNDRAAYERHELEKWLASSDVGRFAAAQGYDVIRVPSHGQWVVLNRSALRISTQLYSPQAVTTKK